MIQNIEPKVFNNSYKNIKPQTNDTVLVFFECDILCRLKENEVTYPIYEEIKDQCTECLYLFSIDEINYFIGISDDKIKIDNYNYEDTFLFRNLKPKHSAFACLTGYHLYNWYRDNKFCGRCGKKLVLHDEERQLYCKDCGNCIYPHISPVVIVGIMYEDKILMSKYANRPYKDFGLIAGFAEVGETIEQTVQREVYEEVGLKVKDITFYKSQPWAYSGSLLLGFWAKVDGSPNITLDDKELSEAGWYNANEIDLKEDNTSLTREMILYFKKATNHSAIV